MPTNWLIRRQSWPICHYLIMYRPVLVGICPYYFMKMCSLKICSHTWIICLSHFIFYFSVFQLTYWIWLQMLNIFIEMTLVAEFLIFLMYASLWRLFLIPYLIDMVLRHMSDELTVDLPFHHFRFRCQTKKHTTWIYNENNSHLMVLDRTQLSALKCGVNELNDNEVSLLHL